MIYRIAMNALCSQARPQLVSRTASFARPVPIRSPRPAGKATACASRRVISASASSGIDLEFHVKGMMCESCTSRVEEELEKKDKVDTVKADLDSGVVTVTVNAEDLATAAGMMEDIVNEINGMGFEATPSL